MKRFGLTLVMIFGVGVVWAGGSDLTGKWSGTFVMESATGAARNSVVIMNLKQDGSTVAGTIGPADDQQWPVEKGSIEGDKVSLEVESSGSSIKFDLVLAGDHLKGDARVSANGQQFGAKVEAERTK